MLRQLAPQAVADAFGALMLATQATGLPCRNFCVDQGLFQTGPALEGEGRHRVVRRTLVKPVREWRSAVPKLVGPQDTVGA